jgi:hypothetical protein
MAVRSAVEGGEAAPILVGGRRRVEKYLTAPPMALSGDSSGPEPVADRYRSFGNY